LKKPAGFESARRKAEEYTRDLKRTSELINQAFLKSEKEKGKLDKVWYELGMLIKMVRAWMSGTYQTVPAKTIVSAVAGLIYFVNPFDIVPDFIAWFGLLDDITVISFVANSVRKDIEKFAAWSENH